MARETDATAKPERNVEPSNTRATPHSEANHGPRSEPAAVANPASNMTGGSLADGHTETAAPSDGADVRAGPGDAGRQDAPIELPRTQRKDSWGRALGALAVVAVAGLLLVALF